MELLVFLRVNGRPFRGDYLELTRQVEGVATRESCLSDATDRFEAWLRDHVE
ncbi:MAG TPA: hypothetical protein VHL09_03910 [Dehalococcoidia bacterium]|nr:hypothetical protein [Dehalococcoidia bacterium]